MSRLVKRFFRPLQGKSQPATDAMAQLYDEMYNTSGTFSHLSSPIAHGQTTAANASSSNAAAAAQAAALNQAANRYAHLDMNLHFCLPKQNVCF